MYGNKSKYQKFRTGILQKVPAGKPKSCCRKPKGIKLPDAGNPFFMNLYLPLPKTLMGVPVKNTL